MPSSNREMEESFAAEPVLNIEVENAIDLNAFQQRHRQMRQSFGQRQFMARVIARCPLSRADALSGKNVAVTAREFIVHQDRGIAPGLASDRLSMRQSHEKARGDHHRRLIADPASETDDVALSLARRM